MRVVKEAEERKNEILDVAERLFCQNGFDQTSTNDILKEIGIARGTLYYHFKSKEDILDAMIMRMSTRIVARAALCAADENATVLERLTKTILALRMEANTDAAAMMKEEMHRPQNALLHQKMNELILIQIHPLFEKIILEGMEQKIFDTAYPKEAVDMIIRYAYTAFDDLHQMEPERQIRQVLGFIYHAERILGMQEGSMKETLLPVFAG